jgi:FkbM family methyltransferase
VELTCQSKRSESYKTTNKLAISGDNQMQTPMTDEEVVYAFPRYQGPGTHGFYTDFLGMKTRTSFISTLPQEGGVVEDYPIPMNFHATLVEWAGSLRAVLAAKTELVALELGAGWGPWLVGLTLAARLKGVATVRLVGVEGSQEHCSYLTTHFRDNGLDPSEHTLLWGVVGTADGMAKFPVLADPSGNWGAAVVHPDRTGNPLLRLVRNGRRTLRAVARGVRGKKGGPLLERVPCYSLPTLLRPFAAVDLVHVDIQGDEYNVLVSARGHLEEKVKRIVVGTHSREIEQRLHQEMTGRGWVLEGYENCRFQGEGPTEALIRDGCQVWRNPALAGALVRPTSAAAA